MDLDPPTGCIFLLQKNTCIKQMTSALQKQKYLKYWPLCGFKVKPAHVFRLMFILHRAG